MGCSAPDLLAAKVLFCWTLAGRPFPARQFVPVEMVRECALTRIGAPHLGYSRG